MIYGYARVSTAAQDESGQVRQLKAAGCEKVFREKITRTTADRPPLAALMKKLVHGDVVITPASGPPVARYNRPSGYRPRHAARRGRYPLTGRTVPRYDLGLCRDHLCHSRCGSEARTPPYPRTHSARPGRRQGLGRQIRPQADARSAPAEGGRKRLDAGETQRSVARSYNVSQSTISRLPA